jgi:hypothetical protein
MLWAVIRRMRIPEHIVQLVKSLYTNQEAAVRTEHGLTEWFKIQRGVRQGCILSPHLFNLYGEAIMRNANLDETEIGISIGGQKINNLRYADDTTLLAENEEDMREMLRRVKRESEKMDLKLNVKKTKVMCNTGGGEGVFTLDGEEIELVNNYTFLGTTVEIQGQCSTEIKRRVGMGRSAMVGLNKIWKDKNVTNSTKKHLVQTLVFPIVKYGCESWTLNKTDRKKIDSFELVLEKAVENIMDGEKN